MACSIDLGHRVFRSSDSDLSLSLSSSLLMLLPPQHARRNSLECLKDALVSRNIWVFQTPELKLNLCVASRSNMGYPLSRFVSQLGDVICKAKLWSDLELSILFKSCIHRLERNDSLFNLSFGIRKRPALSNQKKPAKLPGILKNLGDLVPPVNIMAACLIAIDISLLYDHCHRQSTPLYTISLATQIDCYGELERDTLDIMRIKHLDGMGQSAVHFQFKSPSKKNGDSLSEEEPSALNNEQEFILFSAEKRTDSSSLESLFDLGFKALVGGGPRQRHNKEKKYMKNDLQCLSEIAPSVFNTEYRNAMNQRSRLIPSIAKSIMSILKLSDNQSLKDKLTAIEVSYSAKLQSWTSETIVNNTRTVLKATLWNIAQKSLCETERPQKISPLYSTENQIPNDILFSEACTEDLFDINDYTTIYSDSDPYLGTEDGYEYDDTEGAASILFSGDNLSETSAERLPGDQTDLDPEIYTTTTSETINGSSWKMQYPPISKHSGYVETYQEDSGLLIDDVFEDSLSGQTPHSHPLEFYTTKYPDHEETDLMLSDD